MDSLFNRTHFPIGGAAKPQIVDVVFVLITPKQKMRLSIRVAVLAKYTRTWVAKSHMRERRIRISLTRKNGSWIRSEKIQLEVFNLPHFPSTKGISLQLSISLKALFFLSTYSGSKSILWEIGGDLQKNCPSFGQLRSENVLNLRNL